MKQLLPYTLGTLLIAGACNSTEKKQDMQPPVAKAIPHELSMHGDTRIDPYYWLNERENPEVIAYLEAENAYAEASLAHTKGLQEQLFKEMKGRIKEDDMNVPYFENGYWYYSRFAKGQDYPIYCRKKGSQDAPEEIMFDVNVYAKGHEYFSLTGVRVSPDNQLALYFVDSIGRRQYTMRAKNLATGEEMGLNIYPTNGAAAWANDNRTLFYGTTDEQTLRADKIWQTKLGETAAPRLVFHEQDETFSTYVYKSTSKRFIFIGSGSTLTSEQRFVDANQPDAAFKIVHPRERGLEYSVEDYGNDFYIVTNLNAQNFQLMKAPIAKSGKANWQTVIEHRADTRLEDVVFFKNFMVLDERKNGLGHLRVRDWQGKVDYYIPFNDPAYTCYTEVNRDYETSVLRYGYSSLTTPNSIYAFDMATQKQELLKQQEVVGGFNAADYVSERFFVTARDGAQVPVSLVYKKSLRKKEGNPTLLYGYGSYGASMDAYFSTNRLSLLDRGFVFAIAHIRGGEEMGRQWYEDGKLLKKKNTFYDFIDCAEDLLKKGYTAPGEMYAMGGSAGGLLMGAVVNMRPDLWKGVIAAVPFVDVITTMLDESIPLTTGEFDEWGNPKDKVYYDYMLSYSPYDQVSKQAYPNMLVTTGLHDSQVQYWEPAKWVAKLRTVQQGEGKIYLVTDMKAGHGGKSGRFNALKDDALEFAFLLDLAGIKK
jgi:oligopeptidase B